MIIIIAEHQSLNNNLVCSFCEDKSKPVVGRAYKQREHDFPEKYYLFSYCKDCGLQQSEKMAKLVDFKPRERV